MHKSVEHIDRDQRGARDREGERRVEIFAVVKAGKLEHREQSRQNCGDRDEPSDLRRESPFVWLLEIVDLNVIIIGVFLLSCIGQFIQKTLEIEGMRSAVIKAMTSCIEKSIKMSNK